MERSKRTGKYILEIAHLMKNNLDASFGDTDINGLQARILGMIERNHNNGKDTYQKDIEAEFKIRRSSVSSVLDTMEKNGYIVRQAVEHDARLKKIVMTEKAGQVGIRHRQVIDSFEKNIIKDMSAQEVETLKKLLGKVLENVENMRGDSID